MRWLRSHRSRRGKPRSRRSVGSRPKAHLTLALSSRLKASPGAHPTILNYDTYIYASITCALGLGIVWDPSCMIPRIPWSYTSMYRTIEMLCLIVLDRSRVTSCTREIYDILKSSNCRLLARIRLYIYIPVYELLKLI